MSSPASTIGADSASPAAAATSAAPTEPDWSPTGPTTALLTGAGILVVGQMYIVLPLFGPMSHSFGASAGSMTWMATGFGLAYAAGFLFSGPLSDRYGPRQVILVGLLATTLTTALVATAPNLATGLALRALQGVTASSFAPAAFSYIATRVAPERRAVALSCVTSGFLAAAVLMQVGAQSMNTLAGWRSAFLVCAPLLALAALCTTKALKPAAGNRAASVSAAFAAMPKLLANPRLLCLYAATATLLGGFVALYTAVSLAGPAAIVGDPAALLGLRASALPAMIAVPLGTSALSRIPTRLRLPAALLLAALAALTASVTGHSVLALGSVLLVLVAGIAIAAPALVAAIGAEGGPARGAAVALYACAMFIGASLGPQLANALAHRGFSGITPVVAATFAGGALLSGLALRDRK
ncbi:MFS transporter [Streptomyces melanogenes]|uniref:MFS transporter n=1 Tax=Streptomyces melanogenes TaxID=67326 RepID=UPI00167C97F6|nr:MFS transporter [Streptomyces melanogenes]